MSSPFRAQNSAAAHGRPPGSGGPQSLTDATYGEGSVPLTLSLLGGFLKTADDTELLKRDGKCSRAEELDVRVQ